ncbi:hypothetical protein [Flavobacterium sp.]|uniref:hypothetical protein n=1 Tax=Flavobacterium sp. TaxID=239 RepID=UPI0022BC98C0|nr:hypothetical protein [Flavobacterium sp.]MCZ8229498.1 hypothetical protein [Flavobacterium sp.]
MEKKVVKQVAGIDVAQKELVVTLGRKLDNFSIELFAYKVFKNSDKGILALVEWTEKLRKGHSLCNGSHRGISSKNRVLFGQKQA